MSSEDKQTIACFGATGGCVGTSLALALQNGHDCTALARDPAKLRRFLTEEYGIPATTVEQHLTIHQGDAKNPADVAKALVSPQDDGHLVDVVLSGVGGTPAFQWSIAQPLTLTDPTICETATRAMHAAARDLASRRVTTTRAGTKPVLAVVSTSGCGRARGVPLAAYLPFRYFMAGPLADKRELERLVLADEGAHFRDPVIMRPFLLTDGEARGDAGLRVGWEWGVEERNRTVGREPGPAVGYFISRRDLGTWMYEHVVVEGGWEGKCVYLTY